LYTGDFQSGTFEGKNSRHFEFAVSQAAIRAADQWGLSVEPLAVVLRNDVSSPARTYVGCALDLPGSTTCDMPAGSTPMQFCERGSGAVRELMHLDYDEIVGLGARIPRENAVVVGMIQAAGGMENLFKSRKL
jgi:hypothetical protein